LRGLARSDPQERLKSGHRCSPAVEAKDEIVKVDVQVLGIDSMISTIEPGFEITESPVDVLPQTRTLVKCISIILNK